MTGFKDFFEELSARVDEPPEGDIHEARRKKLVWRMGIAALAIVVLLGGLVLFEYFNAVNDEEEDALPQQAFVQSAAESEVKELPPERQETADGESRPEMPETPKTGVSADMPKTEEAGHENTKGMEIKQGALKTPQPSGGGIPDDSRANASGAQKVASEGSAAPVDKRVMRENVPPGPVVARQPVLPPPSGTGVRPQAAPFPVTPANRLQVGVFSDPRRAEGLHTRLTLEGVPATIETRVHVGPFKNKAEMKSAQAKLKALGINAVVLPPKERR